MGWIGGVLATVATLVHAILGERFILCRLRNEGLPASKIADPDLARCYLRVVWHMVTLDFALSAALLFVAPEFGRVVALHFAGSLAVALTVVIGSRRFDAFWRVPQIYLLLAIAATAWFGR